MTAVASTDIPESEEPDPDEEVNARHATLSQAMSTLRTRGGLSVPVEHILLVAACVLFPLGVVFILLGWDGAAHTGRTYAQIDYLISGGLLGVGLTAAGGFMYFGYWLSRQLNESRRQSALVMQAFERLERAIQGAGVTNGLLPDPARGNGAASATGTASATGADGRGRRGRRPGPSTHRARNDDLTPPYGLPVLVATPRGNLLHRPDCPIVANRPGVQAVPAGTKGYGYCTMCDAAGARA